MNLTKTMSDIKSLDITDEKPITLNIGGKKYETYRSTLATYPDTLLGRMFTSSKEITKGKNEFFFDRDGELFSYVLNYYRNGFIDAPINVPINTFFVELRYWGLPNPLDIDFDTLLSAIECNSAGYAKDILDNIIYTLNADINAYKGEQKDFFSFLTKSECTDKYRRIKMCQEDLKYYEDLLAKLPQKKVDDQVMKKIKKMKEQIILYSSTQDSQIGDFQTKQMICSSLLKAFDIKKKIDIRLPWIWTNNNKTRFIDRYIDLENNIGRSSICRPYDIVKILLETDCEEDEVLTVDTLCTNDSQKYETWLNIVGADNIKIKKLYMEESDNYKERVDGYHSFEIYKHRKQYTIDHRTHCHAHFVDIDTNGPLDAKYKTFMEENCGRLKFYVVNYLEISFKKDDKEKTTHDYISEMLGSFSEDEKEKIVIYE